MLETVNLVADITNVNDVEKFLRRCGSFFRN